jgi:uncharacterized protein (TIGR03437 family)
MKAAALGLLMTLGSLAAQTPSLVTAVGYAAPEPVEVAPGQVITLFVRTPTRLAQPIVASGTPLPVLLGGFSVLLSQALSSTVTAVPILSVRPVERCSAVVPAVCTSQTAISVQIPFELIPNVDGSRLPENSATLTVSDGSSAGEPMLLRPVTDRIHVVNSCDLALGAQTVPCGPVVKHADGAPVTAAKPALAGETITLEAYGLGFGSSRVVSGAAAPSPEVEVAGIAVDFRYGLEAVATRPGASAATVSATLVPGSVGLYRLSFAAPAAPAGLASCSSTAANAAVTIGRAASFDGAPLCLFVAPVSGEPQTVPPRGRR